MSPQPARLSHLAGLLQTLWARYLFVDKSRVVVSSWKPELCLYQRRVLSLTGVGRLCVAVGLVVLVLWGTNSTKQTNPKGVAVTVGGRCCTDDVSVKVSVCCVPGSFLSHRPQADASRATPPPGPFREDPPSSSRAPGVPGLVEASLQPPPVATWPPLRACLLRQPRPATVAAHRNVSSYICRNPVPKRSHSQGRGAGTSAWTSWGETVQPLKLVSYHWTEQPPTASPEASAGPRRAFPLLRI